MRSVLFLSLLLMPFSVASAADQTMELEAKLNAHVNQYSLSANGLADAIAEIGKRFELPIGVEWVKDTESIRVLHLSWKETTVGDIIGSVVKRYPPYSFRIEQGVIHVFRSDLLTDRHNFLNLKVPDFFDVRNERAGMANVELRGVVQDIVSARNLPPGAGVAGEYATGLEQKPISITLRGLTIRAALSKLADASESKMWVVTFSADSGLTPTGFRRTETLCHPTPFPDGDQPMWDFLAWQEYRPDVIATPAQPRQRVGP